jgi:hypothetical protein
MLLLLLLLLLLLPTIIRDTFHLHPAITIPSTKLLHPDHPHNSNINTNLQVPGQQTTTTTIKSITTRFLVKIKTKMFITIDVMPPLLVIMKL